MQPSTRMSPNQREAISAVSSITGKQEYLWSTNHALDVTGTIVIAPATAFTTGQVTIADTATLISTAKTRSSITIVNLGTTDIWVGLDTVTTSTGQLLLGLRGAAVTISGNDAVYAIVASGTEDISYEEEV